MNSKSESKFSQLSLLAPFTKKIVNMEDSLSTVVIMKTSEFQDQLKNAKKKGESESTLYYTKAIFSFGLNVLLPDALLLVFTWHVCCLLPFVQLQKAFQSIVFVLFKGPVGKIYLVNVCIVYLLTMILDQHAYLSSISIWIYILYKMLVIPRIYDVLNICMYPVMIAFICATAVLSNWLSQKSEFFAQFAIISLCQHVFGIGKTPNVPVFIAYMYVIALLVNVIGFIIYL